MTRFDWIEIVICIGLYAALANEVLQGTAKLNFATWSLWALLDSIATMSIIYQHGNFTVVAIFSCGGIGISLCILKSKNFLWHKFETFVASMAVICIVIWTISGPRNATIATTIAVLIAAAPSVRDAYEKPWENSLITWFGFLIVNIVGTIQGKRWSIEERFYPAACAVLCALLLALTARKRWIHKPTIATP